VKKKRGTHKSREAVHHHPWMKEISCVPGSESGG
jgi:hypothetical protein